MTRRERFVNRRVKGKRERTKLKSEADDPPAPARVCTGCGSPGGDAAG